MLLTDERHKQLNIPWSTEIDLINVTYKNLFEAAGDDVDTIKERFIEYLGACHLILMKLILYIKLVFNWLMNLIKLYIC